MKYILLDLDGTIIDPKLGITKAIQYALKGQDILIEDVDFLNKFIGPPLREIIKDSFGFDDEETEKIVVAYREYFAETGLYECEVYEGLRELLFKLKEAGKILITATSKPEVYAIKILKHLGLSECFHDISGATLDNTRTSKASVIQYALAKNNILEIEEVVMIGDRLHDIEGAKANGLSSIGVLYGYGSRDELEAAGANYIAKDATDLYELIMNTRDDNNF
ncbi:MAG: HAD hydrolase-like protein [Mobilitalea sp.]